MLVVTHTLPSWPPLLALSQDPVRAWSCPKQHFSNGSWEYLAHTVTCMSFHAGWGSCMYHRHCIARWQYCMAPVDEALAPVRLLFVFLYMPWDFCERTSSLNAARVLEQAWTVSVACNFKCQTSNSELKLTYFSNVTACFYQLNALRASAASTPTDSLHCVSAEK